MRKTAGAPSTGAHRASPSILDPCSVDGPLDDEFLEVPGDASGARANRFQWSPRLALLLQRVGQTQHPFCDYALPTVPLSVGWGFGPHPGRRDGVPKDRLRDGLDAGVSCERGSCRLAPKF